MTVDDHTIVDGLGATVFSIPSLLMQREQRLDARGQVHRPTRFRLHAPVVVEATSGPWILVGMTPGKVIRGRLGETWTVTDLGRVSVASSELAQPEVGAITLATLALQLVLLMVDHVRRRRAPGRERCRD